MYAELSNTPGAATVTVSTERRGQRMSGKGPLAQPKWRVKCARTRRGGDAARTVDETVRLLRVWIVYDMSALMLI